MIFFHPKMHNGYLGNLKKKGDLYPFKQEARKTKSWVKVDPLMHPLSVKTDRLYFFVVISYSFPLQLTLETTMICSPIPRQP